MNCIHTGSQAYKDLLATSSSSPAITHAKILAWVNSNELDRFPTLEELGIESNTTKVEDRSDLDDYYDKYATYLSDDVNQEKRVAQIVDKFLMSVGVPVQTVEDIVDNNGDQINANARANLLKRVIEVVNGTNRMDSLPEEASHILVRMIKLRNPALYNQLENEIAGSDTYYKVVKDYGTVYNNDTNRLIEEAIGKSVSERILALSNPVENGSHDLSDTLFKRFWNAIKALFSKGDSKEFLSRISNYDLLAKAIVDNNVGLVGLTEEMTKMELVDAMRSHETDLYQMNADPLVQIAVEEKLLTNNKSGKFDAEAGLYADAVTGELYANRITHLKEVNKVFSKETNYGISEKELKYRAAKGTFVHLFTENIMKRKIAGTFTDMESPLADTRAQMRANPEFAKLSDSFLTIDTASANSIALGTVSLYNSIMDADPKAKLYTEFTVYDKDNSIAGTIDLLVVHSDGSASIYDYKSRKFKKQYDANNKFIGHEAVNEVTKGDWDIQIAEQKRILSKIGVTGFVKTRIIPIGHDFKWDYKNDTPETASTFEMWSDKTLDKDYLKQVPVAGEMTDYKGLNNILTNLYNLKVRLKTAIEKSGGKDIKMQAQFDRISRAITMLQLDADMTTLYNEVSVQVEMSKDVAKLKGLSVDELLELKTNLEMYKDLSANFAEVIDDIKNAKDKAKKRQEAAEYTSMINIGIQNILRVASENLSGDTLLNQLDPVRVDQRTGDIEIKPTTEQASMFTSLSNSSNVLFNSAAVLTSYANEIKNETFDAFYKALYSKFDALRASGVTDFEWMLSKDGNSIVSSHSADFWTDRAKAKEAKDVKWFKENYEFDQERYDAKYKELVADVVADTNLSEKQREAKIAYYTNLNPKASDSAWFGNNYFIKPKDIKKDSKYASDKWVSIQNNQAKREYYDAYKDMLVEFNKLTKYKFDIKSNLVPKVRTSTVEALMGLNKHGLSVRGALNKLSVTEHDSLLGNVDEHGNPKEEIPLFFTKDFEEPLSESEISAVEVKALAKYKEHFGKKSKSLGSDKEIKKSPAFHQLLEKFKKVERINKGKNAVSKDLHRSMVMLMDQVATNHAMTTIEGNVKVLKLLMTNQKVISTNQQGKSVINPLSQAKAFVAGSASNVEVFDSIIKSVMYGQRIQGKDTIFNVGDSAVSTKKAIQALDKFMTITALSVDPILASSNFIGGKMNSFYMGTEGLYFNNKQLNKHQGFHSSDEKHILDHFKFSTKGHLGAQMRKASMLNGIAKHTDMESLMFMHGIGDDAVDRSIFLAMIDNWVPADNGAVRSKSSLFNQDLIKNKKSLREHMKVDSEGNVTLDDSVTKEHIASFKRVYHQAVNKVKGTVSDETLMKMNTTIYGKVLFKFRSWMPGVLSARYGKTKYDFVTGELDSGRFIPTWNELSYSVPSAVKELTGLAGEVMAMGLYSRNPNPEVVQRYYAKFLADNPDLPIKPTIEQFTQLQKRKMQALALELRMYAIFATVVFGIMSSLDWDDEEEGLIANNMYQLSKRAYLELAFIFSPESMVEILKEPIPQLRTLTGLVKVATEPSKLFSNTVQFIPVVNKLNKVFGYISKDMDKEIMEPLVEEANPFDEE